MKLPNADKALIEREKILDYLLNPQHPENGGKAGFFTQLGFEPARWEQLAESLKRLAAESEVLIASESAFGRKYVVVGQIHSPTGKSSFVQSIWIMDKGRDVARLVTAYPRKS